MNEEKKDPFNPGLGDEEQKEDPSHQAGHYEHWEHGKVEPKGTPIPGSEGFQGEKKLKLRAKELIKFAGVIYQPDEVFELPEREALNLVGQGAAEELSGDAPAQKSSSGATQPPKAGGLPQKSHPPKK